jgi:putative ABC transport system permease protein
MLKSYFKIGWRAIKNNKAFSLINILGLALGLTCSLLISLWIQDERSMDNFHANGTRLYTVYERVSVDGKINANYNTPGPLGAELKRVIPEIEYASASAIPDKLSFEAGDKIIKMEGGFADSDYFKMFSYPLLEGSVQTALNSPVSLAISEKMAKQFFGSAADAFGKTIRLDNKKEHEHNRGIRRLPPQYFPEIRLPHQLAYLAGIQPIDKELEPQRSEYTAPLETGRRPAGGEDKDQKIPRWL